MSNSQSTNNYISDDKNTKTISDRDQINRILTEFGLEPSDYIFNSPKTLAPASSSKISSRPVPYVQHPPPPPPVINRQRSRLQSPKDMDHQDTTTNIHNDHTTHDSTQSAEYYLQKIATHENPPVKVVKPNTQNVVYKKEIRIRYLQPPTPPPPAPIIIREKQLPPNPPESPLLIRERKPEPLTPPPLTIRERPPSPPPLLEPYIIDKPLPPPPPQPRQIVIERLPTPPPKPRTVIFEKWLPYKKVKRPILLQKAQPLPPVKPIRNVIIEYEPLKAYTVRRVIEEGVFRVDPSQYLSYHAPKADGDIRIVDRIDDLPPPSEDMMRVLKDYNQQTVFDNNADSLLNVDQLIKMARPLNPTVQHAEKVPRSPSTVPFQYSHSRDSFRSPQHQTPRDSPLPLKPDDIY